MDLVKLRSEIDEIDDEMMALIFRRLLIAIEIGSIKKKQGNPIFDGVREQEIRNHVIEKIHVLKRNSNISFDQLVLEEAFEAIFELILDKSKKIQGKV